MSIVSPEPGADADRASADLKGERLFRSFAPIAVPRLPDTPGTP